MPIEVEDVAPPPEETTEVGEDAKLEPTQDSTPPPAEEVERPKAKARGRPRGSKNRSKAPAE